MTMESKTQPDLIWGTMFGKFSKLDRRHRRALETVFATLDRGSIALGNMSFFTLGCLMLVPKYWDGMEWFLAGWALAEIAYHFYVQIKISEFETRRPLAIMAGANRVRLAKQTCEHMDDVALALCGWHRDGKDLHFGHIQEWLVQMFFAKPYGELTPDEAVEAGEIIDVFHARMGFPERVPCERGAMMIPHLHPIRYETRSALFYAAIWAIKRLGRVGLAFFGFTLRKFAGGIECWSHHPIHLDTTQPPIVFFPGIGFGPMQYIDHLRQLQDRHPRRAIFVLASSHTALSASAEIATESHMLAAVDQLMADHHFDRFSLVGHSFGTLFSALMVNFRPRHIAHFTLIDPICFMFWEASLTYNSQFAPPDSSLQYVAVRFITKDPLFAAASARLMYWPSTNLLPENIPCPADIYLSSKDWAIDPQRVQDYLLHRKRVSNLTTFNVHLFDVAHQEYMLVPDAYNHINNVI